MSSKTRDQSRSIFYLIDTYKIKLKTVLVYGNENYSFQQVLVSSIHNKFNIKKYRIIFYTNTQIFKI